MSDAEPTPEEQAKYQALCFRIECAIEGVTVSDALIGIVGVLARICASAKLATAVHAMVVQDLAEQFERELAEREPRGENN